MLISDWSSDVCASDLSRPIAVRSRWPIISVVGTGMRGNSYTTGWLKIMSEASAWSQATASLPGPAYMPASIRTQRSYSGFHRSEEHTSELQSLMRISYAVFCLKKKKEKTTDTNRSLLSSEIVSYVNLT